MRRGSDREDLDRAAVAVCALVRTERTVRTYPAGNELSERALDQAQLRILAAVPVRIQVQRDQLACDGVALLTEARDRSDLPGRLYRDGVREIELQKGLDPDEVRRFIRVLATPIHPDDSTEDYVTMLWEADLPNIRIVAIDPYLDLDVAADVLEGREVPTEEINDVQPPTSIPLPPEEAFEIREQDRRRVAMEVEGAERTPPWRNFVAALLDVLGSVDRAARAEEVAKLLETTFYQLLVERRLDAARELIEGTTGRMPPVANDAVGQALSRMAHPERLEPLEHGLREGELTSEDVEQLLLLFGERAPESICALLDVTSEARIRQVYLNALVRIGSPAVEPVLAHFEAAGAGARCDLLRVLVRLRDPRAAEAASSMLGASDASLRREAVRALSGSVDDATKGHLFRLALEDCDPLVRLTALRAVTGTGLDLDRGQILARLQCSAYGSLQDDEKDLLFDMLGANGDGESIPFLRNCVRSNWLLGRSDPETWRRGAGALRCIGSEEALAVLREGSSSRVGKLAAICQAALRAAERAAGRDTE
ncbi:MAG: HEAT repeat domain-containing protein [Deltaproteobacteria bacterium]|nr:HEAT repeat domain-containing protein [Deltaproteobacteria bacterium]